MRIEELRSTLHEHADVIGGESPASRVAAVHGRIRTARRRRVAAAAGGTVAAVAAVALAVVPGLGTTLDAGPATSPPPSEPAAGYARHGVVFRDEVLGERLIGARIGDPGQARVRFTFTAPRAQLRFSPSCSGAGPDYMVHVAVEGHEVVSTECNGGRSVDPGGSGAMFDGDPAEVLRDWGAAPGEELTVTVTLERGKNPDGPVTGTDAVIGAGVYADTRPTRMVAGVEVPEVIEQGGRTWWVAATYESDPGGRRLWIRAEGPEHDEQHLMLLATGGFEGETTYEVRRDGDVVDAASMASGAEGPSWQTLGVFEAGAAYELEVRVQKGGTDRTRLAFVEYLPAD